MTFELYFSFIINILISLSGLMNPPKIFPAITPTTLDLPHISSQEVLVIYLEIGAGYIVLEICDSTLSFWVQGPF